MVVVYVISSVIIVFLLHQLYECFKNTLTVRKNTNLAELYAKKYQAFIDRALAAPSKPDLGRELVSKSEPDVASIDKFAVSDDLSKFVSDTF
jgi:hypothetical protein